MDMIKMTGVYNPEKMRNKGVLVVGVGATGSALSLSLAKLNLMGLEIADPDTVEGHNLCNQILYGPESVGQHKAAAARIRIFDLTGTAPMAHFMSIKDTMLPFEVVCLCVDTMAARKNIFDTGVFQNGRTRLLLDIRITARQVMVYSIDPTNPDHVRRYRETLYSDEEVAVEDGGCGVTLSIGATAHIGADLATWQFIDWTNDAMQANEIVFIQRPYHISTQVF